MAVSAAARRLAHRRAQNCCEYCGISQDDCPFATFHVDHVIALQHDGGDDPSNLCLACHWCNFNKGTNIASQEKGELVPLFNPRQQTWDEHFQRQGPFIVGRTAIGRVTVRLLKLNDEDRVRLRQE